MKTLVRILRPASGTRPVRRAGQTGTVVRTTRRGLLCVEFHTERPSRSGYLERTTRHLYKPQQVREI